MTVIFRIDPDVNQYKKIRPDVPREQWMKLFELLRGDERAGSDFFFPATYSPHPENDRLLPADFMSLSASFAISERACAKLSRFILPENELIPLRRELDGY